MAIVFRQVKGAPLTIEELDGNFEDLDGRVAAFEEGTAGGGRSIDYIEQVGNSLIVHYTDETQDGPFPLGTLNLFFRDAWQPETEYIKYDIVTAGGATYMVLFAHTSDVAFDPGANDGEGNDYYGLLLANPSIAIPTLGNTDQVLIKASDDSYDTIWASRGVPPDGATGDILVKLSSDEGDYEWRDPGELSAAPIFAVSADNFIPNSIDYANVYFRCTNDSGCTVTIPLHSFVAFSIGTELHFRQCSVGPVVLVGDSDTSFEVVLNAIVGFDPMTAAQGAVITAKKIDSNQWDVWGYLATATA
jgi:Carbohydrate-binding module family 5/12